MFRAQYIEERFLGKLDRPYLFHSALALLLVF